MPGKTTIASLCGVAVGITFALSTDAIPTDGSKAVIIQAFTRLAPLLCVTTIVLAAMRRWTTSYDHKSRKLFQELADERDKFRDECRLRAAKLDAREQRINRTAESDGRQLRSSAARLTEALRSLAEEREKNDRLKASYDELAADYNLVVIQAMQDRANRFRRSVDTLRSAGPVPYSALRVSPDTVVEPKIPLPIRLRRRSAVAAEPSQHDRPVDSLGGPA
ncbi:MULTISPECIES: DUF4200 domain-containing protein [unclassified Streptomyces]|uniref:DUF4200 domain-containing protein n=1 Tax=unclassified Streptomyces TaxID=2593676 RepID=UPI0009389655|nr:DUF4200 domain-containing protein [Streptomyces sp. TSRI0281]OKI34950.1 hypothetical protein A6A29_16110 [Streptomyces sp. TSRI0281]